MNIKKILQLTVTLLFLFAMALPRTGALASSADVNFLWAKGMGGSGSDNGLSTVDSSGNILTAGRFEGTVDFDPGPGVFNLTSAGDWDIFLSKLDGSGNLAWAKRMGGPGRDFGYETSQDANGNIYLTGYFHETVDFDPGPGVFNLTSAGYEDVFVCKLDGSGNFLWARRMGGTGGDYASGIRVDPNGNVYILGSFKNTADFDPGAGTFNLTSAGADDVFLSRLDGSGDFVWAKRMGGTGVDFPDMLVRDGSGSIYITGSFQNTADFDPGAGTLNLTSAGEDDIFVSRLDESGNLVWAKGMGSPQFDTGVAVALDPAGNIYLAGEFQGTVDFDPGPGISSLTSAGGMDIFISRLDGSGSFVWARRIGGMWDTDYVSDIVVDRDGYVHLTGQFFDTVDFDPGVNTFNLTSIAGSLDAFLCELDPNGNFIRAKSMGGAGSDGGGNISLTSTGFLLTGWFSGTADLDPGPGIFNLTSAGSDDIFIEKFETPYTFTDVQPDYWAWSYIESVYAAGITGGCTTSPLNYCPGSSVTRAQMAIFLLRAEHGSTYTPPAATGMFSDVPKTDSFAPWIEQLAKEKVTGGCSATQYCPNNPVTRAQMAIFLLRAEHGFDYTPPAATGMFSDVPLADFSAPFIEQLANENITGGCSAGRYCPGRAVTRDQMAVFLVRTFKLP